MSPRHLYPHIRDFDLFLFGGTPTIPDPVFAKETMSHVQPITTRRGEGGLPQDDYEFSGDILAVVEIDFSAQKAVIREEE